LDERDRENAFITKSTGDKNIGRILCLEMVGAGFTSLEENLDSLLVTLYKAELAGIHTRKVAMILFGTGNQRLAPAQVMPILLKKIEYLLMTSHGTEEVILVVKDSKRSSELSEAMNSQLGRPPSIFKKQRIMGEVVRNIRALHDENQKLANHNTIAVVVEQIERQDSINTTLLSTNCRKMCEFMLDDLFPMVKKLELHYKITEVANIKLLPKWIASHFHMLKIFEFFQIFKDFHEGRDQNIFGFFNTWNILSGNT
jgi:hypothetical protein